MGEGGKGLTAVVVVVVVVVVVLAIDGWLSPTKEGA